MQLNNNFHLGSRLQACADSIRKNTKLCDVGTDHALLPAWLILQGKIQSAVACDIRKGPLQSAAKTLKDHNICGKVKLILSDGLEKINSDDADDIVIAGMGGELICKIIDRTIWLKNKDKRLILQPMTKIEVLREYLNKNGFYIENETAVFDTSRAYTIITAVWCPEMALNQNIIPCIGLLTGEDEPSRSLIKKELVILKKKSCGAKISHKSELFVKCSRKMQLIEEKTGVKIE